MTEIHWGRRKVGIVINKDGIKINTLNNSRKFVIKCIFNVTTGHSIPPLFQTNNEIGKAITPNLVFKIISKCCLSRSLSLINSIPKNTTLPAPPPSQARIINLTYKKVKIMTNIFHEIKLCVKLGGGDLIQSRNETNW